MQEENADFIFYEFEDRNSYLNRLTFDVIGAAIEVHRRLGPGFLERIYENAFAHELHLRGIPFERQAPVTVYYKDAPVGDAQLDFLVAGRLIVELKSVDEFWPVHTAQLISYLRATRHSLGLLINFNVRTLSQGVKRIALR